MRQIVAKHQSHDQGAHRSNYGRGEVFIPEYVSIVGSGLSNPAATLDVLVRDDPARPVYWQTSMQILLRRLLGPHSSGRQMRLIFDPTGPHAGQYQPIFDLVLRPAAGQYRMVKSVQRLPASGDSQSSEPLYCADVVKADREKRYTFSVVYKATNLEDLQQGRVIKDNHREFVIADELQRAQWGYIENCFRTGNHNVFLQHARTSLGNAPAGNWVDLVTWPFEVRGVFKDARGASYQRTVPKNSVWMGVIWLPWSWELVKQGEIKGLSLGGTSRRFDTPGF